MWVLKLGGSLFGNSVLNNWLSGISEHGKGRVVVVPGGGPFADAVRLAQKQTGFDDVNAHRMALLAMEQYAFMLAGMNQNFIPAKTKADIESVLATNRVPVWLPSDMALADVNISASWDMTSDSLAAWLGSQIGATGLLLVKSCVVPRGELNLEELARQHIVDPLFPRFASQGKFIVQLSEDWVNIEKYLASGVRRAHS
jgi:5-(aminomethyl)-3-furanmethanol phosphate kinase